MNGKIIKIDKEMTAILTEDNRVVTVHSLFLPINLKPLDTVEIDGDKIVLRV